jgi:hypothetical protein
MFTKITQKLIKAWHLGFIRIAICFYYKIRQQIFITKYRAKASKPHDINQTPFLSKLNNNQSFSPKLDFKYLIQIVPSTYPNLTQQAQNYTDHIFDLLGSGPTHLNPINWHLDFRLAKHQPDSDNQFSLAFYADIAISYGQEGQILTKDIKLPWELSRCQHLPILGLAWQKTSDSKFLNTCTSHIDSWIAQNPCLIGVNWKNSMEVGIRAINWIWLAYFLQKSSIPNIFWQKFNNSLLDHMSYIEHNWEIYDTITNNHYLSNLLGYMYLCLYFRQMSPNFIKKAQWCHQEFILELKKQILPDGTHYEGSSGYHKLVHEMVYHFKLASQELDLDISQLELIERKMSQFSQDCTTPAGNLVLIGDHDAGVVTKLGTPKPKSALSNYFERKYPNFGLNIRRTPQWHITLCQKTPSSPRHPSSHKHLDLNSITVATPKLDLIVDPGTYVYTASSYYYDLFKSAPYHNTITAKTQIVDFKRKFIVNQTNVTVIDYFSAPIKPNYRWNFTLNPNILPQIYNKSTILFSYKNQIIGKISSPELSLDYSTQFYAPSYGKLVFAPKVTGAFANPNRIKYQSRLQIDLIS